MLTFLEFVAIQINPSHQKGGLPAAAAPARTFLTRQIPQFGV
jgi:hypothetical protein